MKLRHLLLMVVALAIGVSAQAQTKGEKIKEFADKYLRLSGYLQAGFKWEQSDDPETSFYVHRARLSITGDAAQEKIDYRLQVDMAGTPKICDLYFRYKPLNALNLQIGQFKIPFSYENENCGPTTVEFIEYSYITTYLARNNGRYDGIASTGRDIGFQIYGGFIEHDGYNVINYNLGVFNGNGINLKDHNSSKDYITRLVIKPFVKGLAVTGSFMYAETEYANVEYMKSPRWAVGVIYDSRHWVARSEYAEAMFGNERTRAFYALGGYHFEKPVSIFARYEFINGVYSTKDKNEFGEEYKVNGKYAYTTKLMDEQRIQLGVAYKPFRFLRIQSNLSYRMPFMTDEPVRTEAPVRKNSLGFNLLVTAMF